MERKILELKAKLKPGTVYRREDLLLWSKSIDRHLEQLHDDGSVEKLSQGLYYVPEKSVFGNVPPDEKKLVSAFLKEDHFLITSFNAYNSLGLGTTQLYNERIVYNRKRHGVVKLGKRSFHFHKKFAFPKKATEEYLIVDLVNNLDHLAEDQEMVLTKVKLKAQQMNKRNLNRNLNLYGNVRTKKLLTAAFA
ncbi:MAG: hypothetical protein IPM92_16550 [Saprospiraceae bacterium]|nr:hypothetical protein [Saprospiraceae bacterium]